MASVDMASDDRWVVVEDDRTVSFVDPGGMEWHFPLWDCSSEDSARWLIAKKLGFDKDAFDFSIGGHILTSSVWRVEVNPDTKVDIILSRRQSPPSPPKLNSTIPLPPAHAPTPPLASIPPPSSVPPPFPVRRLESLEDILTANGYCTLPIQGCESRVFQVRSCSDNTSLQKLGIYRNLRQNVPAGRWADLGGNLVAGGRAIGVGNPEMSIGSVLAGRINGLQDMACTYVMFQNSTLVRTGTGKREESTHLEGDPIYRWLPYASKKDAVAGLAEPCLLSFSVVENWAEVESDASRIEILRGRFVGEDFTIGERRFFAIVGSRDK